MHQNVSIGSNGVDPVRSLRKIPTRLRGTNFCTSSVRFALSFVGQPNGPECTQIIQNATKYHFRVQRGGSGAFVGKYSDTTSWHEFLHQFGPSCTEFCRATKRSAPKQYEMQQNVSFGYNGVDRVRSLRKIPTRLRGTNFCTSSARFAPSFVRQPNGPEWTQIVRNASKCQFRARRRGSGAFVAKYSDATSCHELLH